VVLDTIKILIKKRANEEMINIWMETMGEIVNDIKKSLDTIEG